MDSVCSPGISIELLFGLVVVVTIVGVGAFLPLKVVPLTVRLAFALACLTLLSLPLLTENSGISISSLFVTGVGSSGFAVEEIGAAGQKFCLSRIMQAISVGVTLGIVLSLPAYVASFISFWSIRFCKNSLARTSVRANEGGFLLSLEAIFAFLYLGTFIVILPDVMNMMAATIHPLVANGQYGVDNLSLANLRPVIDGLIGGTFRISLLTGGLAALPLVTSIAVVELFAILAIRLFPSGVHSQVISAARIGAVLVALMMSLTSTEYLFYLTSGEISRTGIGSVIQKTLGGVL